MRQTVSNEDGLKQEVIDFWDAETCGEVYAAGGSEKERYEAHAQSRYSLEPYIHSFAQFNQGSNRDVLEIGVGMGADHVEWAKSKPKCLAGIDISQRAVEHTRRRLAIYGLASDIRVGDAENLGFGDNSFDLIYSWGVLHHSPDTCRAVKEVWRTLRPNGIARIMIYHKYSITGYMLWCRYALGKGRPLRRLDWIYSRCLESPGTKAYTVAEAGQMFAGFSSIRVWSQLSFGDLLQGAVGQRHRGILLALAKSIWPRRIISRLLRRHGLMLLIEARK
jgi:ubiquinone/menaquinone biosynthesis C-methylase UbiE